MRHCPDVEFLHLSGTPEVIGKRQASRPGHFMPASLLASQFETLEPLEADERGIAIDVDQDIDSIVENYVASTMRAQPNRRTDESGNHHIGGQHRVGRTGRRGLAVDCCGVGRYRADRRADHRREVAPVPRADLRRHDGRDRRGTKSIGDVLDSFADGFGTTAAGVGILIALGAMFAKLLADSGGADEIVDTIVGHASPRALPWAMALVGAIIGLPMFFEIGLVLLMPVIYLVAKRSQLSLITVGIPALAGFPPCTVWCRHTRGR